MRRGLSASTISRLKESWKAEYDAWSERDLSDKEYVYLWADGVYFQARLEESKQCMLVLMGATKEGKKELVAIEDGYRESEQSWLELLLGLKRRGLTHAPSLAIGGGALGFWKAIKQVFSGTRWQRCWVHKIGWGSVICAPRSAVAPRALTGRRSNAASLNAARSRGE